MKQIILTLLVISSALTVSAHDYFFAFAEMEYNAISEKMELTLVATTHDFERALEMKGTEVNSLVLPSDADVVVIESYVNAHFSVGNGDSTCVFRLIGQDESMTGTTNFYFESSTITITNQINIHFDFLMEIYDGQQNKLTFFYEDKTMTAAFTPMKRNQTLYIENKPE